MKEINLKYKFTVTQHIVVKIQDLVKAILYQLILPSTCMFILQTVIRHLLRLTPRLYSPQLDRNSHRHNWPPDGVVYLSP